MLRSSQRPLHSAAVGSATRRDASDNNAAGGRISPEEYPPSADPEPILARTALEPFHVTLILFSKPVQGVENALSLVRIASCEAAQLIRGATLPFDAPYHRPSSRRSSSWRIRSSDRES